ncbi:urease accessory protein UreD [Oceanicella actignis]|uniref:urease accessory protein UreD n=1 Tax=Oceanicella actignis TaxID=1189325 RepID=UPI001256E758|nr:urease accessory protein UreD [Oceanicella actignis]TYO90532.1 urease accessory protein [Oceanicella actignis]
MTHQRARGHVAVSFAGERLGRLAQAGCGRIMMPRNAGGPPLAVVLNTAGGLTGGDRFAVEAELSEGARLAMTTQAAERAYRSIGGAARVESRLRIGRGCTLWWLPQETILFERSALARRLEVEMAEDACFIGLEMLVLGRRAMGETLAAAQLADRWRIRRGGRLAQAEALRLGGDMAALARAPALLDGARAIGLMSCLAPGAEALLPQVRQALARDDLRAAASAWEGRIVVRMLAPDLAPLKALAARLVGVLGAQVPTVWQI